MPWSHATTRGLGILGAVAATIGILDAMRKVVRSMRRWHDQATRARDLEQGSVSGAGGDIVREGR